MGKRRSSEGAMNGPMRMMWLVVVALGGAACQRQPPVPRTPDGAYLAFAEALRKGDNKTAWASLSKPTHELVSARTKEIVQASNGLVKDEPALMLFQSGTRPAPIGEVKVLQADGSSAVLEVAAPKGPQKIKMLKDGDRWVVDLTEHLSGAGSQQPGGTETP